MQTGFKGLAQAFEMSAAIGITFKRQHTVRATVLRPYRTVPNFQTKKTSFKFSIRSNQMLQLCSTVVPLSNGTHIVMIKVKPILIKVLEVYGTARYGYGTVTARS